MKKLFGGLLCLLVVALGVYITVLAIHEDSRDGGSGYKYELSEDGEYYIVTDWRPSDFQEHAIKYFGMKFNLYIPSRHNGLPVKEIGSMAFSSLDGEKIIFDNGEPCRVWLWWDCKSAIRRIVIPDSVESIGSAAFSGSGLASKVIPSSVRSIGEWSFKECYNLKSVRLPDGIISISSYAFVDCTSLKEIVIPDEVTYVGDCVFLGCTDFTIYCEAKERPEGWSERWSASASSGSREHPVVFGYIPK